MKYLRLGLIALAMIAMPAMAQDLDERKTKRIDEAIPAEAPAKPKAARKVLVYTRAAGFVHSSIPYGAYAIEQIGKKTGAYESVVSNNPEVFAADNLEQFDGIILVSTTTRLFEGDEYKEGLLNFVKSGKGIVGIHAATDCFYTWDAFGEMMGGYFDGHPWNANNTVTINIDDPAHPVNKPFGGKNFDITDEIYQFAPEPYSRKTHRVLLSLDTSPDSKTDLTRNGIKREDKDFAVAWVKTFGDGRVFYCSLGHNEHVYWNADVLAHYLAGIQYALGDLEADDTPSAELDQAYLDKGKHDAQAKGIEEVFAAIGAFDYNDDGSVSAKLEAYVVDAQNDPTLAEMLRPRLTQLLTDSAATRSARWLAAKHLNRIGDASTVDAIAPLLNDPEQTRLARYALERLEAPAAHDAIINALGDTEGAAQIGMINAAGQRRLEGAVLALSNILTQSQDVDAIQAAAQALGRIGSPAAARTLNSAHAKAAHPEIKGAITDGLLASAERLAASGGEGVAQAIYTALNDASEPVHVRGAALQGLARLGGDDASAALIEALTSDDGAIAKLAVSALNHVEDTSALRAISERSADMAPGTASAVIAMLGTKGNAAAAAGIKSALDSEDPSTRHSAIRAMGKLGGQMAFLTLTPVALKDNADGDVAQEALSNLAGRKVGRQLADAVQSGSSAERKAYIPVLVARRESESGPALAAALKDQDASVRKTALDAIADLDKQETFPEVLALLLEDSDESVVEEAGTTLTVLANNMEADHAARHVIAALELDATDATAPALYNVLSRIGGEQALAAVKAGLDSDSAARREAALRSMAQWPSPDPMMDLLAMAESVEDETLRTIAYRGFLDQAAKPNGQSATEKLTVYEKALGIAPNAEEEKRALSALANVLDKRVFDVVKPYMEKEDFKATAQFVLDSLSKVQPSMTASHNSNDVQKAVDGDPSTRWTTGEPMSPGMWFLVDQGWQKTVTGLTLDTTQSGGDYPRAYEVYLHDADDVWGEPAAKGETTKPVLELSFPPTPCRFVRIVQTGKSDGLFWSIHELTIETQD